MPPPPPLQKQPLDIPLGKGLADHIDPRVLPPGGLTQADNVVVNQQGALEKRSGYQLVSDPDLTHPGSVPPVQRMAAVGSELVAIATQPTTSTTDPGLPCAFSYAPTAVGWVAVDDVSACSVRRDVAHRSAVSQSTPFVTYTNGYLCYWWVVANDGIYVRVVDPATGAVVLNDVRQVAAASPVIVVFTVGTFSCCVYADLLAAGNLTLLRFSPSTVSTSTFVLDATPIVCFDAAPIEGDNTNFALIWIRVATPNILRVRLVVASTGASAADATYAPGRNIDAVAVAGKSGSKIYAAWYETALANINGCVFDDGTLLNASAPVLLLNTATVYMLAIGIDSQGRGQVLMDASRALLPTAVTRETMTTAGVVVVGQTGTLYQTHLISRPFRATNGRTYALMQTAELSLQTAALVRTDQIADVCGFRLAGVVARGVVKWPTYSGKTPSGTTALFSSGVYLTAVGIVTSASTNFEAYATDLATFNFNAPQAGLWETAQAQGCLTLTGGMTGSYDGMAHVETGFLRPPTIGNLTASAGAGTMALGSYAYLATYEWIDSKGNIHTSAISQPVVVTLTGVQNTVTVTVTCLGLTERDQPTDGASKMVRIHLFRTRVNSSGPIYRLTGRVVTSGPEFLVNSKTIPTLTFVDTRNDTVMASLGYGFIYTDGGILESQCAPPSRAVISHKNRLWLASCEDGKKVYYSKIFTPTEAPGFNEILSLRVDDSPDDVTALATLDDGLVIFTRSRIYVVVGDGPDDTGLNGSFSTPKLVSTNDGCIDPRSVVSFSGGVFFQSSQGLSLLARDLTVSYAGANVLSTLGSKATILGVSHDTVNRRLIWLMQSAQGPNRFVVYDYGWDVWATWTITYAVGLPPQAHTFWNGSHVYADSTQIYLGGAGPNPGYDNGAYPTSTIATSWIHPSAIGGFQRVLRLILTAYRKSAHVLIMKVYVDFDDVNVAQTWDLDLSTGGSAVVGLPVERIEIFLLRQKCSAVKFVIHDETTGEALATTTPLGFSLAGMTLMLGIKQGTAKVPAANRD